jgi:hypothetical protein
LNSEKKEQNFEYEQTSKLRPGDRRARQAKQRTPGAHPPATSLARERNRRAKVNMIPTCVRACAVYLHGKDGSPTSGCGCPRVPDPLGAGVGVTSHPWVHPHPHP